MGFSASCKQTKKLLCRQKKRQHKPQNFIWTNICITQSCSSDHIPILTRSGIYFWFVDDPFWVRSLSRISTEATKEINVLNFCLLLYLLWPRNTRLPRFWFLPDLFFARFAGHCLHSFYFTCLGCLHFCLHSDASCLFAPVRKPGLLILIP